MYEIADRASLTTSRVLEFIVVKVFIIISLFPFSLLNSFVLNNYCPMITLMFELTFFSLQALVSLNFS